MLSEQDESFCQAVAHGDGPKQAWLAAGYDGDPKHASKYAQDKLRQKPLKARIEVLKAELLKEHMANISFKQEWVLEKFNALWDRCWATDNNRDCIALLKMAGPEVGIFNPERKSRHGQIDPLEGKSGKELMERIRGLTEKLPASAREELGLVDGPEPQPVGGDGAEPGESSDSAGEPLPTVH